MNTQDQLQEALTRLEECRTVNSALYKQNQHLVEKLNEAGVCPLNCVPNGDCRFAESQHCKLNYENKKTS